MDLISGDNPSIEPGFSLNNFKHSYNEVFIKQETQNEDDYAIETPITKSLPQQLRSEEDIKLEDIKEEAVQHGIFIANDVNVEQNSFNEPKKLLCDDFRILTGPNNEKKYGCKECDFSTKHKVSLYRHVKLHSGELQSYKCQSCGFETVYKRHFDVHVKVLHQNTNPKAKEYKCDQCSYQCNYRENLSRHKKTHLAPEERTSFICQLCGFETYYKKSYRVHMEMVHQTLTAGHSEESEFKCYHCPFETKYRVNIIRHLKTHMKGDTTIYKCSDCDFQTIHKTNFNTHVLRHKDPSKMKIFECQHCSHKTFYKASLRNHLKLHMKKEEIETYKCDVCDFATIYERSLRLHVLYMHNGDHQVIEYFKCNFCDFETRYRENWRRHEKNHTRPGKQDTYNCTECSFSTIQQGRYERHILTHANREQLETLQKPKKTQGKKRFRSVIDTPTTTMTYENVIDNFQSKTFTDGGSQELTMFQCCHCSYKTLSKQLLDEHLKSHNMATSESFVIRSDIECKKEETGEVSDECSASNEDSHMLDMISYTSVDCNKKQFECGLCSFTTIHRSSMRRHRETHLRPSERRVFKCPTCIFRSFTRARVNSHECPNRNKSFNEDLGEREQVEVSA